MELITENGHKAFVFPSAGMGQGHRGWIARCVTHGFFVEEHQDSQEARQRVENDLSEHLDAYASRSA